MVRVRTNGGMLAALATCALACQQPGPPVLESMTPELAPSVEPVPVTITGHNFLVPTTVDLNSGSGSVDDDFTATLHHETLEHPVVLEMVEHHSHTTITALVPANIPVGSYTLAIDGPYGGADLSAGYRVCDDPDGNGVCGSQCNPCVCTDADADGWGPPGSVGCPNDGDDCDDDDGNVNPGATESPGNTIDENCDDVIACYLDADGDGYGDHAGTTVVDDGDGVCLATANESMTMDDCNDGQGTAYPSATENCTDGFDTDCDGDDDSSDSDCWLLPMCDWRIRLTFDNSRQSDDLVGFPVLVRLDDTRLNYSDAQPDGSDVRFVDAASLTLPHEIEQWNDNGVSLIWVRVDLIRGGSSTDAIEMYFDCPDTVTEAPTSVWQDYAAVWHLSEDVADDSSGAIHADSTAHANHAAQVGNARAPGPLGYGQELDGNDYLRVSTHSSLEIGDTITLETWVRLPVTNSGFSYFVGKYELDGHRSFALYANDMNPRFIVSPDGASTDFHADGSGLLVDEWTYMAGTFDGTDGAEAIELYINGVREGVTAGPVSGAIHVSDADVTLGCDLATNTPAALTEGSIDEVRIRPDRRSAAWIAAQYQSMTGTFVVFEPAQIRP